MFHVFILISLCWCRLTGAETKEPVSVTEGDSVTLNSGVTEILQNNEVSWYFENSLIAIIAARIFSKMDGPDGRFRDRLKLDNTTGSLTITKIRNEHAGDYKVQVYQTKQSSKTFIVSVYARLPVPVITRDSPQCSLSSSSCSVVCSVVNVSHVTLSWLKGNSLLSSISVSDLSISLSLPLEVEDQDTNNYSCVLNNSITHQTTHLDISGVRQTCKGRLIALISAGAGFLIVAAVGIFWIYNKKRKTNHEADIQENDIYAEPTFNKRRS